VAVGVGTNQLLYSTDGKSWQASGSSFGTGGYGRGVAYGLSSDGSTPLWAAVGEGTNQLLYSTDGQSWQASGSSFGTGGFGNEVASNEPNPAFKESPYNPFT